MNYIQELEKLRSFLLGAHTTIKDEIFIEVLDFAIDDINRLIVDMRSEENV